MLSVRPSSSGSDEAHITRLARMVGIEAITGIRHSAVEVQQDEGSVTRHAVAFGIDGHIPGYSRCHYLACRLAP